jgi:hypothetical protein
MVCDPSCHHAGLIKHVPIGMAIMMPCRQIGSNQARNTFHHRCRLIRRKGLVTIFNCISNLLIIYVHHTLFVLTLRCSADQCTEAFITIPSNPSTISPIGILSRGLLLGWIDSANIDGALSRFVMGNFTCFDCVLSWILNQIIDHLFWKENFYLTQFLHSICMNQEHHGKVMGIIKIFFDCTSTYIWTPLTPCSNPLHVKVVAAAMRRQHPTIC